MPKRVLICGNCLADTGTLIRWLHRHFEADTESAPSAAEVLAAVARGAWDLVLLNRVFDQTGERGIDVMAQLRQATPGGGPPCMLISNFPDHQRAAVEAGAVPGFGKAELERPETLDRLRPWL